MSRPFLDSLAWNIQEPADSSFITAEGKEVVPLGIMREVPVRFGEITIPVDMNVSNAETYDIILGNDWLKKAQAKINVTTEKMTITARGVTLTVNMYLGRKKSVTTVQDHEAEEEWESFSWQNGRSRRRLPPIEEKEWYRKIYDDGWTPDCPCPHGIGMWAHQMIDDCSTCRAGIALRAVQKTKEEKKVTETPQPPKEESWDMWTDHGQAEWGNDVILREWDQEEIQEAQRKEKEPPFIFQFDTPKTNAQEAGWQTPEKRFPIIKYRKLTSDATAPERKSEGAAAYDMQASQDVVIEPMSQALIPTGIEIELPNGYCLTINGRSGGFQDGLIVHHGIVDMDYRGEPLGIVWNITKKPIKIWKGE